MEEAFAKLNLDESLESNVKDTSSFLDVTGDEKEGDAEDEWKWWEKELTNDGTNWTTLEHNGPAFPPPYAPLRFFYDGKLVLLSDVAEEFAGVYARDLDHAYTTQITKKRYNDNFFKDWRSVMTSEERDHITDFSKCDFSKMHAFYQNMFPDKKRLQEEKEKYGYCIVDGRKERLSGYSINPPDLVKSSTESLKNLKVIRRRVRPEDVTINCSVDKTPEAPPGHKWKETVQNNKVKWLASWKDSRGTTIRMQFHRNSGINGKDDYQKYETARKLHTNIKPIRDAYKAHWADGNSIEARQRAVALYIIDQLALRVGIESEDDHVGCCSLLVSHITLIQPNKVEFNFTGKTSIEYSNEVTVEPLVFENLEHFMEGKKGDMKLFDKLSTHTWNKYLKELMPGLTGKVFRTYHASKTFEENLNKFTKQEDSLEEKIESYQKANVEVANLCNHIRNITPSKGKPEEQTKIQVPGTQTSKEYYNDPRITAAWCHKHDIPHNTKGIFAKDLCEKFNWAIAMVQANPGFQFIPIQETL